MFKQTNFISNSFKFITIIMLITWLIMPLIPLVFFSFSKGWVFPFLLPKYWSLNAWNYALSDTAGILESLWLTIFISLSVTILSILIGVPAGRALGIYKFKGKVFIELIILAPIIIPSIAVVLGIHSVFISIGLTNTIFGVILVHLIPTVPYMTLVMSAIFSNFDADFEYQARSLGASSLKAFYYITLPAILPGVVIGGLFAFLVSWSQYILTLVIGGGKILTLPLLLFSFATSGRNDITGAIGILYILPSIIILIFTTKYLSRRNVIGVFERI